MPSLPVPRFPPVLSVEASLVRRFQLLALGLGTPHVDVTAALAHHGYVQIAPINVCGRMHDLIPRPRVADYREGDLWRHTHGGAAPLPAAMAARARRAGTWSGALNAAERKLAPHLLATLAERGPLNAEAFTDTVRGERGWGTVSLANRTLQKLFFHGRVLIARRDPAGRRCYDLPERVLPPAIRDAPAPSAAATARWGVEIKLRQRRLCSLTRAELTHVADLVQPVRILAPDPNRLSYALRTDAPFWEAAATWGPASPSPARLLAPLDPLLYNRALTAAIWDFAYTWEVYTPPDRRRRGYYALPVLTAGSLVGHFDPKADRPARRLVVQSRAIPRRHARTTTAATRELATWLGLVERFVEN